jgi:hypothetical protein
MARPEGPTWAGFVLWALVGAASVVGFFTLSVLFLVPIVIGVAVLAIRPTLAKSAVGLLAGMGLVSMYVAYVQRRGPGTVCWQTGTASGCDEYLNPWPWLVFGVVLVCVGVVAHLRAMRRAREDAPLGTS